MIQNISAQIDTEDIQKQKFIKILSSIFTKQNIFLYIISFMVSMVNCGGSISPFGLAMLAAASSNMVPIGGIYVSTLLGTLLRFGPDGFLNYILTSLVFIVMMLIFKPKYKMLDDSKVKNGKFVVLAVFSVELIKLIFNKFMIYDLLMVISITTTTYIFYKIFANSLIVIKDYGIKKAFAIEEVVGASLLLAIAFSSFGNLSVFGLEIRNILCILLVLILGWKNGILLGTTSGVTIRCSNRDNIR